MPTEPEATPDATPTPDPRQDGAPTPPSLAMRHDRLVVDGFIVGEFKDGTITLNLGWCRAAGIGVRCLGDPEIDRNRNGVVLDRPAVR